MNRLIVASLPLLFVAAVPLALVAPAMAQDAGGGHASWGGSETKAEAEQRAAMAFSMIDTNHDGVVTQDELNAFIKAAPDERIARRVTRMFSEADVDHDGRLTADEAKASADRSFDAADTNHDGVISPEERQAARARMQAQQPQ
jgi:Ca2+-binding EF-hand superfamily protein